MSLEVFEIAVLGVLAALSLLLFFPLNTREPRYLRKSWLVGYIPFLPSFIIAYLALFPFITFTLFVMLLYTPIAERFYVSVIFAGLTAALVWYFFPTGVSERPKIKVKGPFTAIVAWTYSRDPRCNALPSSHVFTAFLSSYYLTFVYPTHEMLIWGLGTTIMGSTLFVKQHHVIDIIAGLLLAGAAIGVSYLLLGSLAPL